MDRALIRPQTFATAVRSSPVDSERDRVKRRARVLLEDSDDRTEKRQSRCKVKPDTEGI